MSEGAPDRSGRARPSRTRLTAPALILAADHRARGVMTIERYSELLGALRSALAYSDGILASAQPLADLADAGDLRPDQRTYLSINRTGLAGAAFELDDRLVASVDRAAADGWSGVKIMTRIDLTDPDGADALELLGQVLEDAETAQIEALVEPVIWRHGRMSRVTDDIVTAAVIAHDIGAPLLKVPVPDVPGGNQRVEAAERVVGSVGVPVLFLGGPHRGDGGAAAVLAETRDVMAGGAAGLAVGRAIYQDADPAETAKRLAEVVHGR
jgi:DhnA family fructose-bisphosphate aldolase class Ia